MIVLIAEKPSVGMELARITGCKTRRDGYMEGGRISSGPLAGKDCCVTWALGHLVEIGQDHATAALHWKEGNLPVIPETFTLEPRRRNGKPDPGCVRQLAVIQRLFSRCEAVVNCGDAGREGELIQRYIHRYVIGKDPSCDKPVWRMWTSSMTDEALRAGLRDVRPGREYDPLYEAGRSRNEADWLVGINATEALTLAVRRQVDVKRVFSIGRVQTPILALVCRRYLEHRDFRPTPFWTLRVDMEHGGAEFHVIGDSRFMSAEEAEAAAVRCRNGHLRVVSAERQAKTVRPPLLHDLTSLQQEASRLYGIDPDETLALAQKLYEAKLLTYPRTGSRFITRDVLQTLPDRFRTLSSSTTDPEIRAAAGRMCRLDPAEFNRLSVNDGKVTDHHALLTEITAPTRLPAGEEKIYTLVAVRMLEAFSAPCGCEVFSVRLTCAGQEFSVSSTRILSPGWKAVQGERAGSADQVGGESDGRQETGQELPDLAAGDVLPVRKAETVAGQTRPKPLYTMQSLMQAIKTAGGDSGDDEIKAALKDVGIGTPATRAAILKQLMDVRKYMRKEKGQKIVPTETGLEVFRLVRDMPVADAEMTGRWEIALGRIAEGRMDPKKFDEMIRTFTRQITQRLLEIKAGEGFALAGQEDVIRCPLCGGPVRLWDDYARCGNNACGLSMNRTAFGKTLSRATVKRFLETGRTGVVRGFVSKAGKPFDARLRLSIVERNGRKYANAEPEFDAGKPPRR